MDQYQLSALQHKINIAPEHILREYYEMAILQTISEDSVISSSVIFYGGTALRLAFGGPRFSEDLDFVMSKNISLNKLSPVLKGICRKYPELSVAEEYDKKNTLFAMLKIKHTALKHPRHIKIEISKRESSVQSEYRVLSSECSPFSPLIKTITLESLEKLKRKTIKERKQPRDWLDLWLILNLLKKHFKTESAFPFVPNEFRRELKRFLPKPKWPMIEQILKIVN